MKLELATKNPAADAVELLHQAAFRSGLGNSLFCAPHKVGSHSPAQLQTFVSKHFTAGRSALLGIGVNHASLAKFGELLNLESGSGPADVASKYGGGEVRTALTAFYKDHFLSPPYPARALHQHLTLLILESIQSSLLSSAAFLLFSLFIQGKTNLNLHHHEKVRAETGGPLAYVAIAGNCAGAVSVGDCVAAMLLQVRAGSCIQS